MSDVWVVTVSHPSLGKGAFTCDTLQEAIAYAEAAATRALRPGGAPGFFHATIDQVDREWYDQKAVPEDS